MHSRNASSILKHLAIHTPSNKWEISRTTKKSYSSIHKTVRDLLKLGFIRITNTKPSKKNPKLEVEYYTLTSIGLLFTLCCPIDAKLISTIAKNYKNACFTFRKWTLFEREHVDHIVVNRIKKAFLRAPTNTIPNMLKYQRTLLETFASATTNEDAGIIIKALDEFVLGLNVFTHAYISMPIEELRETLEDWQKLLVAITKDKELVSYALKVLKNDQEKTEWTGKTLAELIATLELPLKHR